MSVIVNSISGLSRIGLFIILATVGSTVYVCYQVFPFYYYYWEIEGHMQAQADKASEFTDAEIRKNLLETIKRLELPIDDEEEDLQINRFDGKIIIDLHYQEVLYIDLGEKTYDLHVFDFHPHIEQPIAGRIGRR